MQRATPIGQARFRMAVRPARAAYTIAAGSSTGLRRAVQEASTRWGGATEPIIPVPKSRPVEAWWRQVLEFSGVDGLVNVDADPDAAHRLAEAHDSTVVDIKHVDRAGITQYTTHPANVLDVAATHRSAFVMATSSRDLWEVVAAGDLTPEHEEDIRDSQLNVRRPRTPDEIGRAQLSRTTLLDATTVQFGEHAATNGPWPSPAVLWVTTPNSYRDALFFWNLRALRSLQFDPMPIILVPNRHVEAWVGYGDALASALTRQEDIEPDVIICGISATESQRENLAQLLGLVPSTNEIKLTRRFPAPPARTAPHTYRLDVEPRHFVAFGRSYGRMADAVVQIYEKATTLDFASPVEFTGQGHAIVEISSSAFDGLPRRKEVAELVQRNATWSADAVRVVTGAARRFRFELDLPSPTEVTRTVLESHTTSAAMSNKGQLAARLYELGISVLLTPDVSRVIAALTTPRSKELRRELNKLRRDGHPDADLLELAASWGGRASRRYRSAAKLAELANAAVAAAEALASAQWAERGLEIKCNRCTLASFVPLADTRDLPICPACQAPQQFEVNQSGPAIHYRLNALVDRASDQGVLPHLHAVAALSLEAPTAHFMPGVDVTFDDGTVAEVDLFGTREGKVLAGEAKTSAHEFSQSQLVRDVALSARLGADLHVMATSDTISAGTVQLARTHASAAGLGLLVVSGGALQRAEHEDG